MSSTPQTPPAIAHGHDDARIHGVTQDDLLVLDQLITSPSFSTAGKFHRREAPLDPLIYAAAVFSGPHVTRHHFHHNFFTGDSSAGLGLGEAVDGIGEEQPSKTRYFSQQKPRSERFKEQQGHVTELQTEQQHVEEELHLPNTTSSRSRRPSLLPAPETQLIQQATTASAELKLSSSHTHYASTTPAPPSLPLRKSPSEPAQVQCCARTRIPTPHGPVFLHLYKNNVDSKEHLAVVVDPAQLDETPSSSTPASHSIRSKSLEVAWEGETPRDRLIRGAYVGRLSPTSFVASSPPSNPTSAPSCDDIPPPLVRIHSECFTGETIGSMRCDCGEQLDEAIRLISLPQSVKPTATNPRTIPGRGAVIYLRQEGRGIGLLEKIRAYNLQDMGHDTVSANLILGHGADERNYDVAAAIMRDLGLGAGGSEEEAKGVRLLTNNPEKMAALESAGIRVSDRVPMVPRSWKCGDDHRPRKRRQGGKSKKPTPAGDGFDSDSSSSSRASIADHQLRRAGATLIGGGAAYGVELERYLKTKVQRMGHMLDLPDTPIPSTSQPRDPSLSDGSVSDDSVSTSDDDHVEEPEMSRSVESLLVSRTPDLESDRGSFVLSPSPPRAASPI